MKNRWIHKSNEKRSPALPGFPKKQIQTDLRSIGHRVDIETEELRDHREDQVQELSEIREQVALPSLGNLADDDREIGGHAVDGIHAVLVGRKGGLQDGIIRNTLNGAGRMGSSVNM